MHIGRIPAVRNSMLEGPHICRLSRNEAIAGFPVRQDSFEKVMLTCWSKGRTKLLSRAVLMSPFERFAN
jgi:hypothetical protein